MTDETTEPEVEEPQPEPEPVPVRTLATCHVEGCGNADVTLELFTFPGVEVYCGACSTRIEDVVQ